jgi:hypothetical protein
MAPAADPTPADPLPLQRLLISPERLPFELQRVRQGALIQMTRDEFEARVAEAARAREAVRNPPRLVEARYHARLIDTALIGTAEWTVLQPSAAAGILPLQPFDLAVRQAQFDNGEAILGDLEGKALALAVERCGKHRLSLAWSARGERVPGGLHFQLRVPSCVLTSFDLECPADRVVNLVGENGLLSGPQPAPSPDQRIWRLQGGGSSPADLLIRRTSAASERAPLVLARLRTRQKLAPDLLEADYDFSLEIAHGGIRELVCEGDPVLQPTAVTIGGAEVETWEVRPGPTPDGPFTLWIRLPDRVPENAFLLRVHCLAPVAPKKRWTSPALRLKGAVPQGETLVLQLSPEVQLADWQPGSFELIKATSDVGGEQSLTLQSGLGEEPKSGSRAREAPGPLRSLRPGAQLRAPGSEYQARQVAWWQVGPDTASLTVQIDYEVDQGRLFRLPLLLPANWSVDRVELSPGDLLRNWTLLPADRGQTQLIVDLQRPLETPSTARLTLQLRPASAWPIFSPDPKSRPAEFSVPFPEILPLGARLWDGALAIRIDLLYEATLRASLPATAFERKHAERGSAFEDRDDRRSLALQPLRSLLSSQPPWGVQPPDYLYTRRGQLVRGSLTLRPRPPRVRAHCTSEIVLATGRSAVSTRLLLQPDVGNPDTVDLLISAPVAAGWNWRSKGGRNAVKQMQRLRTAEILPWLLPLGAGTPLAALGPSHPLLHRGTWWRLTLAEPLREPLLLETTFPLPGEGSPLDTLSGLTPLAAGSILDWLALAAAASEPRLELSEGSRWQVPLVTVLSAEPMDGEVQLYVEGSGVVQRESEGLAEVSPPSGPGGPTRWGTFRYSRLPVALVLDGRIAAVDRSAAIRVDRAHLVTYVELGGRLLNYYSFQVRNWEQGTLPLRLPAGAQVLAAKVDGRWVARPTLQETTENVPVLELPIAAKATALWFEVVYSLRYPAGTLWSQIHAPLPVLPRAAVALRHTWCLPAGFMPLHEGLFQQHPGPSSDFSQSSAAKAMSLAFLTDPSSTFSFEDWRRRQERLLAEADAHLQARQREHKDRCLGEALYYLTHEFFKGQEILIVDALALREAGLQPATPIPADARSPKSPRAGLEGVSGLRALDSLGLVCIPCRPAPLLTTRRLAATWQNGEDPALPVSDSVAAAISEATAHGRDRSGRFRTAADWLRDGWGSLALSRTGETQSGAQQPEVNGPGGSGSALAGPFASLPHPDAWTEWEPIAGLPSSETLVVLRQDSLWGVAYSLTGVLLLVWWWARRHGRHLGYRLLLFWLAASILGLLWLPAALRAVFWWPMLAGIALAAARYLASALASRIPAPASPPGAAATAVLVLVFAAGLPGEAAAPRPSTVWLLPGPADAPEKFSALVPPELLSQLQSLARRGAAGLEGVILQSARYEGAIANGVADFQAEFQAYCFTNEASGLTLPLGGVELREAVLDGNAAYPTTVSPPQNGYVLRVQGRGAHTVRVHFTVRIPGLGEDRDLRFTIPELVQSQLTLLAPEGARYLQVIFGRGAQRISPDPKGVRVEADLGRVSTLQVHWRQESPHPRPATVEVKEAYYWDVQASGSRLLSLLDYALLRGAVTELAVRLPESVEVRRVELVSPSAGGFGPRLKDWTLSGTGAGRQLRLEFQGPVMNEVQVLLELVPRQPLARSAALGLPTPEGVSFGEGVLAYRIQGLQGSLAELRGLSGIEPSAFERLWQPAEIEYPGLPEQAYRFLRGSSGEPFLRLELHAPPLRSDCVQDLTWYVDPQQATLRAKAKLMAPHKDLTLLEWEIPSDVTVAEVRGADIRNWSRAGSRLQIWLQRSVAEATLELTGWTARHARQPVRKGDSPLEERGTVPFSHSESSFELPCLAFPTAASHTTVVRVVTENGWASEGDKLRNLEALPDPRSAEDERSYLSKEAAYGGVFHLRPAAAHADLNTLSLVEVRDRRIAFRATLDYETGRRKSRTLTVHVRNWKGQDLRLETRPAVSRQESGRNPQVRTWTLELPPTLTGRLECQLTGTLTLDSNANAVMPDVSVDEAIASEQWLVAIGPGLRPEEQRGLAEATGPEKGLDPLKSQGLTPIPDRWPAVADALHRLGGSVWKIDAPDWKLHLRADFPLVESSPVQVFLDEQAAAIVDGRRWLHQATYWLYQESGTHLGILLPHEATLMMAALDGSDITPLQTGSELLWLPLTGGSGLRVLRLRWVFYANRERLDSPRLETPRLQSILYPPPEQRTPTLWTVHIPPGYERAHAEGTELPGRPVEGYLYRAAAQWLATRVLVESSAGKTDESFSRQLRNAQLGFYRYWREAKYELEFLQRLREQDARAVRLTTRLQHLYADNQELARARHFERIRARAELEAAAYPWTGTFSDSARSDPIGGLHGEASLAQQGTPTYWQVPEKGTIPLTSSELSSFQNGEGRGEPQIRLVATHAAQTWEAFGYSGLLLVLFLTAWILPSYPRAVAWLQAFWPEEMALLGGVGWLLRGDHWAFLVLLFLGGAARLVYLGRWLVTRLRRPAPAATTSGATSAT